MSQDWQQPHSDLWSLPISALEAVASPTHRTDTTWRFGISLNCFAQPMNMHIESSRVTEILRFPYLLHQIRPTQYFTRVPHKGFKQQSLLRGQMRLAPTTHHTPLRNVKHHTRHGENFVVWIWQKSTHPIDELLGIEWVTQATANVRCVCRLGTVA